MTYTHDDFIDILKDCDYPSALIPKVAKDLVGLSDEARSVFEKWERSRVLADDAFDLGGISPKTIREKKPKIQDIAILLVYDHLVKHLNKEFDFLFGAKERDQRKAELERNMAKAMFKSRKGKSKD